MRVFTTECKDSVTGYAMVLSECSYNMACDWLERTLKKYGVWVYQTKTRNNLTELWTMDKHMLECRRFYYDENRGVLLGEQEVHYARQKQSKTQAQKGA